MTQQPEEPKEPVALAAPDTTPAGHNGAGDGVQPAEDGVSTPAPAETAAASLPVAAPSAPAARPSTTDGAAGLKFATSVLVIVVFMITFVVQAFRVPSESMENTLLVGDFLLADKVHFASDGGWWGRLLPYRPVHRGDIVVFRYPVDPTQYFVKRVVGLPGDHVRLQNKAVYVNGQLLHESYVIHSLPGYDVYRDSFPAPRRFTSEVDRRWRMNLERYVNGGELIVPPDQYFVMGDNRDRSLDSRYWGFVPRAAILGRPLLIYLSVEGPPEPEGASANDRLLHSGQMLAHFLELARWDRMFRLVR